MAKSITNTSEKLNEFAKRLGIEEAVLKNLIERGVLQIEKRGKDVYVSMDEWQAYLDNFTFDGFLLANLQIKVAQTIQTQKAPPLQKQPKINKPKPDIEKAMLENWDKQYQKIYKDFLGKNQTKLELAKRQKHKQRTAMPTKAKQEASVLAQSFLVFAMILNIAFYYVYFAEEQTVTMVSKVDKFVTLPEKLALNLTLDFLKQDNNFFSPVNTQIVREMANDPENKSEFIRNNNLVLSESVRNEFMVKAESVLGRVAGAEEIMVSNSEANKISVNEGWADKVKSYANEYINRLKNKQKDISGALKGGLKNIFK